MTMGFRFRCLTALLCTTMAVRGAGADDGPINFTRDVAPILERSCIRCHRPGNAKGDVSLASPADLLDGGHIVPGKPGKSTLLGLVAPRPGGKRPRMPKDGKPLTSHEISLLRRWVAAGALWPKDVVIKERARADKSWWSLRPLADVSPPTPAGIPREWAANPIDRFVFAGLMEKGLSPSPQAEPGVLIRRLSYDLTGLPPDPERAEALVKDPSPAAYEKLVDELLASPAYGEHWGRHWLDVVRFGESTGFERNVIIDNAWPFRDYVIRSFNSDKPFDRFVKEQLAGDLLAPGDPDVEVGTGFLVAGPYDNVGNQDAAQAAVIRANTLDDMIRATGETFLGMTVGCARCHNHKFDPITQQDYYRLYATFAGVTHGVRAVAPGPARKKLEERNAGLRKRQVRLESELAKLRAAGATENEPRWRAATTELANLRRELAIPSKFRVAWIGQFRPAGGPFHVFTGGDPQKKGETVAFAGPEFLSEAEKGYVLSPTAPEAQRRAALAKWIVAPENPLTPRVLANRLWHYHFGTGIVDTPSDFGYMGGKPSHPELLDWLARRLQADEWRLKALHKLIVTSQTYKQSSAFRRDAAEVDANSRLLWRFPPRRLSGEEVRDSMLAVAGKLDPKMGGPGFRLYRYVQDNVATYIPLDAPGPETYRRAVYHQNARAARVDVLSDFDCPDPASASPRRASTTTPLQALTLFNHKFTLDMATALADRAAKASPADPVGRVFAFAYARPPTRDERAAAEKVVATYGLRALCRAVLNSNEFLYVD